MNPCQEKVSDVDCSSALTDCGKTLHAQFSATQQRLELILELSRSLAAVVEGDNSLARHFGVPLASDSMAGKLDPLFGQLQLMKDDEGEVDNSICWLDVVLAPSYNPTRREDGYYYLRLDGRSGLIRVSEADHNLIESGIPQKLINPRSYPSDVQSEAETMRLVQGFLLDLNNLTSQIIELNNKCRKKIGQRLETLKQLSAGYSQNTGNHNQSNHVDLQTTEPPEPATPRGVRKRKPSSIMHPWEPDELNRLPRWFQDHRHLTRNEVEARFQEDFGRFRTFSAIVTANYRARNGHGTRRAGLKRKLHPDDSLLPSTAIESAHVAITGRIDPFSPASGSDPRPSFPFLAPLRSLGSPRTSTWGTTEKQCTESHRTTHVEAVTPRDAEERPLWINYSSLSAPRTEVDFDPTGTAVLNPEPSTRDDISLGRDRQSIQRCPARTRERNESDRVQDVCGADSVASPPPTNLHYQLNSGGLNAPAVAPESAGAGSSATDCRVGHTATANIHCLPLGVNATSLTRNDYGARDDSGEALLLPVHHEQEPSSASISSAQSTARVRRSRNPRAASKGARPGISSITCRHGKRVCDGQSPTWDTYFEEQLPCEGYNSQEPTRPKDSSTPQLQGNQSPQEDTPHNDIPVDSIEQVMEGNTAADHYGLSGQQHSVSATNEDSPWMLSNGSSPRFVSGQDTPDNAGVLPAVNRLPLPINPNTGPQVIPPIDQVLRRPFVLSTQPAFSGWSASSTDRSLPRGVAVGPHQWQSAFDNTESPPE